MKHARPVVTLLLLAAAGAVQAGSTGAGPAASAGPGIGSIVTPGSHELLGTLRRDDQRKRVTPGDGGSVMLSGEQLTRTAAALRAFVGATEERGVVQAPTVLADGTPATISLDTGSGRLSVARNAR